MSNMINNNINSIERMTEAISKRKKQDVNATYNGPSFTEILSRQKSIDELVADRTEQTVVIWWDKVYKACRCKTYAKKHQTY